MTPDEKRALRIERWRNPGIAFASPQAEADYKEKFANPYNAARYGFIDDVIEPRNTRFRIIRALQSLTTKKVLNLPKKHSNLPL